MKVYEITERFIKHKQASVFRGIRNAIEVLTYIKTQDMEKAVKELNDLEKEVTDMFANKTFLCNFAVGASFDYSAFSEKHKDDIKAIKDKCSADRVKYGLVSMVKDFDWEDQDLEILWGWCLYINKLKLYNGEDYEIVKSEKEMMDKTSGSKAYLSPFLMIHPDSYQQRTIVKTKGEKIEPLSFKEYKLIKLLTHAGLLKHLLRWQKIRYDKFIPGSLSKLEDIRRGINILRSCALEIDDSVCEEFNYNNPYYKEGILKILKHKGVSYKTVEQVRSYIDSCLV